MKNKKQPEQLNLPFNGKDFDINLFPCSWYEYNRLNDLGKINPKIYYLIIEE